MKTVVLGEPPPEIVAFLARRRALGLDRFDEVWEGDYHVVPAPDVWHGLVQTSLIERLAGPARAAGLLSSGQFNLGAPDDYRVPDGGYHRAEPSGIWIPTAAIVVEIVSPRDETWAKLPFYARHGVEEILVADPHARSVQWFAVADERYEGTPASALLGVTAADLVASIAWPG